MCGMFSQGRLGERAKILFRVGFTQDVWHFFNRGRLGELHRSVSFLGFSQVLHGVFCRGLGSNAGLRARRGLSAEQAA